MSEPQSDRPDQRQDADVNVVVGVSGASGAAYASETLAILRRMGVRSHFVASRAARLTVRSELGVDIAELAARADVSYGAADVGACIASGSFKVFGMVIAPCSIRTMSEIATGVTSSLLTRAADVMLKERRPLVLMVRETPLHLGHLRTMAALAEMGAILMPPVPAFYAAPTSVEDVVRQSCARALDLMGLDPPDLKRWTGLRDAMIET